MISNASLYNKMNILAEKIPFDQPEDTWLVLDVAFDLLDSISNSNDNGLGDKSKLIFSAMEKIEKLLDHIEKKNDSEANPNTYKVTVSGYETLNIKAKNKGEAILKANKQGISSDNLHMTISLEDMEKRNAP